ncbi:MAG: TolC family protein [Muribaculaceae bacterium]|nr:TolC family protein [Muribaculaceae bacterium]
MRKVLKILCIALFATGTSSAISGQTTADSIYLNLEQCRQLALQNNKQMQINREKVKAAEYQKKEAFAAYLPAIDFAGGYAYNQKKLALFDSDQMLPTKSFDPKTGKYEFNLVTNPETGLPVMSPSGEPIPSTVALIPKSAMEFDIHNLFFGAVTVTQPVYMGGKIVALNKMASLAKEVAESMRDNEAQNVIYAVDAAYWQVVSLQAKQKLAQSFVNLLDTLDHNVDVMLKQGVATRSDKLMVDVKLNQAQVDLTKVNNGVVLSKMALAQLCGLPVDSSIALNDDLADVTPDAEIAASYNMDDVYNRRDDIHALSLGVKVAAQQANVARASMLPNIALMGSYSFSNPNSYDGFKNRFGGAFSVGVMVSIPIWHWGGNYYKYKNAATQRNIMELQLADAKQMVELQVNQASFKAQEALKTYHATLANLDSANENLRTAQIGFREGVMTSDDVMEAQTAWLKAHSENIDAIIDVHLCDVYLSKVLGTL